MRVAAARVGRLQAMCDPRAMGSMTGEKSGNARKALVCEAQARRLPSGDEFEK